MTLLYHLNNGLMNAWFGVDRASMKQCCIEGHEAVTYRYPQRLPPPLDHILGIRRGSLVVSFDQLDHRAARLKHVAHAKVKAIQITCIIILKLQDSKSLHLS